MQQENEYLSLLETTDSFRSLDGYLIFFNDLDETVLSYNAAVIGSITTADGADIPEDAVVNVKLSDVSLADAPAVTIVDLSFDYPGKVPFQFNLIYNPDDIDPRYTYSVQVRITDRSGKLLFINTLAYHVITHGKPSQVDVAVDPVG
jgi:uncharacterized lipoprotein YbaY